MEIVYHFLQLKLIFVQQIRTKLCTKIGKKFVQKIGTKFGQLNYFCGELF